MTFEELGLGPTELEIKNVTVGDKILEVKTYLPIDEKADLIKWVIDMAIDDNTGCFSPIRLEVFSSLAICKWYAGLEIDSDFSHAYDLLVSHGVMWDIFEAIPNDEFENLSELVNSTIQDVQRYNTSAAGIIQMMSSNAEGLDSQISSILEKIKNGEGMEQLAAIKDVVGKD